MDIEKIEKLSYTINFVDFIISLNEDDYSLIKGIKEDDYYDLVDYFYEQLSISTKTNNFEEKIEREILILESCVSILATINKYDKDVEKILNTFNLKLGEHTLNYDIEKCIEKINSLKNKLDLIKSNRHQDENLKNKKPNPYDLISSLAVSLEFDLGNYDELKVAKYISLSKSLKNKAEILKNNKNGSKKGKSY